MRGRQTSSTRYGIYRSGLEFNISKQLTAARCPFEYERRKVWFIQPAKLRSYTPDFILPNGIIIEAKGRFLTDDRQKSKYISAQHPDLDVRFVFSNPNAKINKGSPTSYAMWCETYGFAYAAKLIPQEWIEESTCMSRWSAIEAAQDKQSIEDQMP